MRFIDLNRRKEIGSSCLFVSIGSFNILFDCGVSPKYCGYESLPDFKKIGTSVIDLVLISHCHLDHIGALPYFMTISLFIILQAGFESASVPSRSNI